MTQVVAVLVALSLLVFAGAHVSLLASLLVHAPRLRALVALVVPPLAPYWGWQRGVKVRVYVWATALALYAMGVAVLELS
jgi:hypothetical protein